MQSAVNDLARRLAALFATHVFVNQVLVLCVGVQRHVLESLGGAHVVASLSGAPSHLNKRVFDAATCTKFPIDLVMKESEIGSLNPSEDFVQAPTIKLWLPVYVYFKQKLPNRRPTVLVELVQHMMLHVVNVHLQNVNVAMPVHLHY